MCHHVDRKIITSPTQIANGKPIQIPPTTPIKRKNVIQLLMERVRNKLMNCQSNDDTIDGTTASDHFNFNYKFDRNFEMRPNNNLANEEEKRQVRNWRYHLTNDHF